MKDIRAEEIISKLELAKHPEGGWYKETHRSEEVFSTERGERSLATVIYFMLKDDEKSAFHRLKSDEFWYFHQGTNLTVHVIYEGGEYKKHDLGIAGEGSFPQLYLPAGCWFAAECRENNSFSLVSCSVHPGFDFTDFELAAEKDLQKSYPQYSELISQFCIG
ncbi:MAG: cupin domain-containing protein [Lentisphaeraceae bacterium]|nr:cupin domain-containing protein [Lentisphaeraceae bacterium]